VNHSFVYAPAIAESFIDRVIVTRESAMFGENRDELTYGELEAFRQGGALTGIMGA